MTTFGFELCSSSRPFLIRSRALLPSVWRTDLLALAKKDSVRTNKRDPFTNLVSRTAITNSKQSIPK